jgi:NADPH-dependent glutamate synthase beta subunit-like oxidoreductase
MPSLKINDLEVKVEEGSTVLDAIRAAGVYVPTLCYHPDLVPHGACRLCIVEIEGIKGFPTSCTTPAEDGMVVYTDTERVKELRREILSLILEQHPHECIICPQREGCSRTQCSSNVPEDERCCPVFDVCEFRKVVEYVGIREGTPKYIPRKISGIEEPFFIRDPELCIVCGRCVRVCQDVIGASVLEFVYKSSDITVSTAYNLPLAEVGCRFDGCCVEVCPTGALRDRTRKWDTPPCDGSCPLDYKPSYMVYLTSKKDFRSAVESIQSRTALPGIVSYICQAPCERDCRRGTLNEPISIRAIERFLMDNYKADLPERKSENGKKVAVIGSGPAGLSAAYWFSLLGYSVTVFEAESEIGGGLRFIPEFKLPRDILEKEINKIASLGVEFKTNARVSSLDELADFDAVLLTVGRQKSDRDLSGRDLRKIISEVISGREPEFKSVALIGGILSLDTARTLVRSGVEVVFISNRLDIHMGELEEAEREGVRIYKGEAKVQEVEGGFEVLVDGQRIAVDEVIYDNYVVDEELGVRIKDGLIVIKHNFETSKRGVFAAGSAVLDEFSIAKSLATVRRAVEEIDKFLGGNGFSQVVSQERPDFWLGRIANFAELKRVKMPVSEGKDFELVELGFGKDEAVSEAIRCLRCDLRLRLEPPPLPPEEFMELAAEKIASAPETEGVVRLFDAEMNVIFIKGTENIRSLLEEYLEDPDVKYFAYEEDKMFTKRESELIQEFLQKHGRMPKYNDELDDLF